MGYFVGAYASSPNVSGWDPELESAYYDALKNTPSVKGLEHPFLGKLHPHDDDWFLQNIDTNWQFVFTCIPGIMSALDNNPQFGLASTDSVGRQQAIDFMQSAQQAVAKLNAHAGRQVVKAIEIQTAPNRQRASSSVDALVSSLETIREWDWQGAQLIIEHCDTLIEGQKPAKGFLTIEDEIKALKRLNLGSSSKISMLVNWGRSVIETRSEQGALDHIALLKANNLLAGLMFSGVSEQTTEYGEWADTHMPPAPNNKLVTGAAGSLLTEQQMHDCMLAAGHQSLPILGIKLGIRPTSCDLEQRVNYIKDCLAAMERCAK